MNVTTMTGGYMVRRERRFRWLPWPKKYVYVHAPVVDPRHVVYHYGAGEIIWFHSAGEGVEIERRDPRD